MGGPTPGYRSLTAQQVEAKSYQEWVAADLPTRRAWSALMEEVHLECLPDELAFDRHGLFSRLPSAGSTPVFKAPNGARFTLSLYRDRAGYRRCPVSGRIVYWLMGISGRISAYFVLTDKGHMSEYTITPLSSSTEQANESPKK